MGSPVPTSAPAEGVPPFGLRFPAATITWLTAQWQGEARPSGTGICRASTCVYVGADGIHVGVRLVENRLCVLVLMGCADGTKELMSLSDGLRELAGSWAGLFARTPERR